MMKYTLTLVLGLLFCTLSHAVVYRVPDDSGSIGEAVSAAQEGDTVKIGPGTYSEEVTLDRPIRLIGEDAEKCILKSPDSEGGGNVLTANSNAHISGLTIQDGKAGIMIKAGVSLEVEDCHITGCEDGIGFQTGFDTFLIMRDCLITGNVDGVDLESTQGIFLNCRFVKNKDDGLDLDGDAGSLVYGCTFSDNGDDGIEIRLCKVTHAIILDSVFEKNGEDGIEIINSPREDGDYNVLCVQNSSFGSNGRYGIGFVAQKEELHTGEMSRTAVYAAGNQFTGNGEENVSPNYAPVFSAPEAYPKTVKASLERGGEKSSHEMPVRIPLLVGIYNLRPTTDGTMFRDAEGVTVTSDRVYVADDDSHRIFAMDRRTGRIMNGIPTQPFPGSTMKAPGPEGLDITEKGMLLLADDDGRSLYHLSLDSDKLGEITQHQDTTSIGAVEGAEKIGDRMLLAAKGSKIFSVDSDMQILGDPVDIGAEGFGRHVAGVGADEAEERVFVTLSAYVKDQNWRNHQGGFMEMDSELREIRGFWHLGPFSNDPRGIAVLDSLIYVADGRSDFKDKDTGEMNRGGQKIFVFLLEDTPNALEKALPFLPVRRLN